ncbi:hypothetical protein [Nesterenkonia ebinurensis]|uniref:hypothetical protein n=1 Tax=Nesterenkonia ebinurensis TaxID=2608252 RepID=UPI00123D1BEB|nr:hypothetical protein [Nesterenkonia ebinurensis]
MQPWSEATARNPSWRVQVIRQARRQEWAANDPAGYAESVAYQQALDAVAVPQLLATPADARPWERKA